MDQAARQRAVVDGSQALASDFAEQESETEGAHSYAIVHRGVKPLYVGDGWAALHGYSAAEVMAMASLETLRHPDDRARMSTYAVERAAGRYAPSRYAYRALHRHGGTVWIDVSVRAILWRGRHAMLCSVIGVSNGKGTFVEQHPPAQRPARAHRGRLLDVIDRLQDGYALFDGDERLVFWNQRYVTYAPKAGMVYQSGDRFEALVRDHVRHGRIEEAIGREEEWIAKRLEVFRAFDCRSIDVGIRGHIIQVRHIKTDDGGTLLIMTDVTEARKAERTRDTYASAIDQVADRVSIIDTEYRYLFANEASARFHGRPRSDFAGRHLAEIVGAEHFRTRSKAEVDRCLAGESLQTQRMFKSLDGQTRHYHGTLEPFRNGSGKIVGAIVVFRDITEATQHHEELQLAKSVIDQISERVVVLDQDEKVRLINRSNLHYHGEQLDQVIGKHIGELIGWDGYYAVAAADCRRALDHGTPCRHDYWRANADGEPRFWETSIVPYREADRTISGAIATCRDRTEHRRAEQVRIRFQEAIEHVADGYALFDQEERLVACNRYYREKHSAWLPDFALGVTFETVIRARVEAGTVLEAIGQEEAWIARRLTTFRAESHVAEFREPAGRWAHIRNRRTADGGTLLVVTDITESKRIERALAESETRFKDFTELAADWFWEQDACGRYTYVSESIGALTSRPVAELLGKTPGEVFGKRLIQDPKWRAVWRELQTKGIDRTVEGEHDLNAADGRIYRVRGVIRPIKNGAGVISGYRGAAKDVTEAHRLKQELEFQANHDVLTSLLNRRSFERHLEQAIEARAEGHRSSVFCFIDLDQFKVVNDTAGHLAGDRLLQQVAELLSGKIRKGDILARLGGDEFGLLLRDCSLRRAQNMALKLIAALNDDRFFHGDNVFEIGASMGLTSIKASHESVGQILAEADLACYAAKDDGRNRVQVYQDSDRQLSRRREEMSKASLIRRALDDDRFVLFAQPILPLAETVEGTASYEILLRMIGGDGTLVMPSGYIPAAERFGLMVEIDRWVLRQSFTLCSEPLAEFPKTRININLSGLSLNEAGFVGFAKRLLQAFPIAPEDVCFEITETAAIQSLTKTKALIGELKQIGCRFALDDFGSGLSSFSYLKQLPVDYLKIDGSFIRDITSDERSRTMVEAIQLIAKSLNLQTVAEGVESAEAKDMLRSIGVDFVQGFAIGRPKPLAHWALPQKAAV